MPVVPSSAYVSISTVTLLIRAILNDLLYSDLGELFTDTANITLPLLNDSLEWFQAECINHGVDTFEKETIITPLAPVTGSASTDPATQVYLSDSGYFNGVTLTASPQLPTDLVEPSSLWERQTGSQENFLIMTRRPTLPSITPGDRFGIWTWRQDGIYMPAAIQSNDLRLNYKGFEASFVSTNDILYFRGAIGPVAYKTVATYLASKNPQQAALADAQADKRINQIFTRNARSKQSMPVSRRSYGRPSGRTGFTPPRNS